MANQVLTGVSTVLQCCVKRSVHQQVALFEVLYFWCIIQVTCLDDSMVLFLALLPEEEYKRVLEIFQMYEDCEIEGQKISWANRKKSCRAKIDCKGSHFKPVRGLDYTSRRELLNKVLEKRYPSNVAEMSRYAKKIREVKAAFMSYHQLPTWDKAVEEFPDHTKKETDWNHSWTSCSRRTMFHQLSFILPAFQTVQSEAS